MCTSDENASPYLQRPIRTYEQFLREQADRARGADQIDSPRRNLDPQPSSKGC